MSEVEKLTADLERSRSMHAEAFRIAYGWQERCKEESFVFSLIIAAQARRVEELALDVIALAEHCGELANLSDGPCPAEGLCGEYACEQIGCIKDKADRARSVLLSEGETK